MGRIARRSFHIVVVDEETEETEILHYEAGEEVEDEIVALIDNKSVFEGEKRHSPGNDEDDETVVAEPGHVAGEVPADGDDGKKSKKSKNKRVTEGSFKDDDASGFEALSVAELIQLLKDNDVEPPANARKADLVEAAFAAGLTPPVKD